MTTGIIYTQEEKVFFKVTYECDCYFIIAELMLATAFYFFENG